MVVFISFNPTLVRLRRVETQAGLHCSIWFQSHAGSIEAFLPAQPEEGGEK